MPSPVGVRVLEYTRQSLTEKQSGVTSKPVLHTRPMAHALHSIAWHLRDWSLSSHKNVPDSVYSSQDFYQPYGQTHCDTCISLYESTFAYSDGSLKTF